MTTIMKTLKVCFFVLCGALLLACGGPEEPTQKITEEQFKSYFPYSNGDRMVFFNDLIGDVTYTVLESSSINSANKMNIKVTMVGTNYLGEQLYFILLNGEVADNKIIKIEFSQGLEDSMNTNGTIPANGSYVFDVSAGETLPSVITLSDGSIIEQDKGITYFVDFDSEKWYFKKRL